MPDVLVDESKRLLFCAMEVAGGPSVKHLLTGLRGGNPKTSHTPEYMKKFGITALRDYKESDRERMVRTFTKAIVVRHPFDRLKSVYQDKFVKRHYLDTTKYGKALVKYRQNKSDHYKHMYFNEFLQSILNENQLVSHWDTYNNVCSPCYVKYDYIIRVETIGRDLPLFNEEILRDEWEEVVVDNTEPETVTVVENVRAEIPEFQQVNDTLYKQLLEAGYGRDMAIFGYQFDKSSSTTTCGTVCC